MAETLLAALDIGSSKIGTLVGIKSEDEPMIRIIGFNSTVSRGVKRGLIIDIDQVTASIEESVEKAERMAGHKITKVFVGVGGPHIASLNSHGVVAVSNPQGEISGADIERVVEAARAISLSQTKQIIEVTPREFIVDGQTGIKNPVGMTGVRLEVDTHIITASQTNLKNIDRALSLLGLDNQGFIFSAVAAADAVLTDTEKELGVVLVDLGGGKTDICIYVDGALSYSSSIPIGARHITNDIAVGLRVSLDSAEKIKLYVSQNFEKKAKTFKKDEELNFVQLGLPEHVTDVSLKTLIDGIIAARIEEIFKLIFDEIEKSEFTSNIPSGLVITGGGAETVGLLQIEKKVLGLPVRIGIPEGVTGLIDEIVNPQNATLVGLLIRGQDLIIDEKGFKNFDKILKDFSGGFNLTKVKDFFKQFIP